MSDKVIGKMQMKVEILTDIEEVKEMFEKLVDQNKRLANALDEVLDEYYAGINMKDLKGTSLSKCREWNNLLEEVKENKC